MRRPAASPARPAAVCGQGLLGRGPQPVGPVTARRDPARPGARPARFDGAAAGRPVRGGCAGEARPVVRVRRRPVTGHPAAPLRLTARGRQVVAGLSIAIGLSLAAGTVVTVELRGGGLQLAGSDTVVVRSGDTLWSIAGNVAPDQDRRAVVDAIVELNGLDSVDLLPGAQLQLP
ncbi:LysM peptidoglycan-binding domain-containing protein [Modestobacter sp. VKM Ac-2986]|uniref:LysM peptidoglycan-binding domain-containing protein n=1 Tax=Modestobacter sp. VKM Ac-2986 TaxID=3004140 RepID=UPI0022AB82A6|nr:LysM peptidoglycan-binding domain-containing protein [Modestobacter sp. VKM Ac-2986]MCZ2831112.1 LysM peptidoglycan-binding domain-containing protein [Modestobacter sp. VKM Ac-2986]